MSEEVNESKEEEEPEDESKEEETEDEAKKVEKKVESGIFGYIRVSTLKQELSFDAQRSAIEKYCTLHNLELEDILDDKSTGGNEDRPGYQALLTKIDEGRVKAIVIAKIDRLSRSLRDFLILFEDRIVPSDIKFHSVRDKIDTSSAMGRFFLKIMVLFAEFEREMIQERTITVLNHKRENGEYVGSLPYGFDKNDNGKTYLPNIEELKVVKKIFDMKKEGLSYRAISKALDMDKTIKTKRGGRWHANTVRMILLNEIYEPILKEIEAVVSESE